MGAPPGTPAAEDLAALLHDLPPGRHALVRLGALGLGDALEVAAMAASARGERLVVVGAGVADARWPSLLDAVEGEPRGQVPTLVAIDAQASIAARGGDAHARAERLVEERSWTVLCMYTADALRQVGDTGAVHDIDYAPGGRHG